MYEHIFFLILFYEVFLLMKLGPSLNAFIFFLGVDNMLVFVYTRNLNYIAFR